MILLWLSLSFVIGVVGGTAVPFPGWFSLGLSAVFVAVAVIRRSRSRSPALLILAGLFIGCLRSSHGDGPATPGDLRFYNGRIVTLQGVVSEEPDIRDTGINYVVTAYRLTRGPKTVAILGKVEVHVPRSQSLEYGDAVSLRGRLIQPRDSTALPYAQILARRGIRSEMRFPRVLNLGQTSTGWRGSIVRLRLDIEAGIERWMPEPQAALLIAIALGAKSASLGDLSVILTDTGLIHIIAISGIKVALVAGTLYQVGRLLRSRLIALVFGLSTLLGYVLLTGATVSGERSALMWALVFIAVYLGRGTVALVSLTFVAALMVAFDPTLPWDTGFLLSTIGTFSIVAFSDRISSVLRWIPSPFREALSTTTAAVIGTLPIVAADFHVVSFVSLLANTLVLPLLPALIFVGFALGAMSSIPPLAAPLSACAYALTDATMSIASHLNALPGIFQMNTVPPWFFAVYYAALGALAIKSVKRANWVPQSFYPDKFRETALSLVVAASALTVSVLHAQSLTTARIVWAGSGHAIVIQSRGKIALIDGSNRPFQLLQRLGQVLPFSAHAIDLVVMTDPRPSNVSGLRAVLQHYSVSEVLDCGVEYPSTTYAAWRDDARHRNIPVFALRTGARVTVGDVRLQAVGPDGVTPNPLDSIGLVRISKGSHTVLDVGSASLREQREAVFRSVDLRASSLLIDGKYGIDVALLRAVHPHRIESATQPPSGRAVVVMPADKTYSIIP